MINVFSGFRPGQLVAWAGDITENTVRNFKHGGAGGLGLAFFGLDMAVSLGTAKKGEMAPAAASVVAGTGAAIAGGWAGKRVGGLLGGIAGAELGPMGAIAGKAIGEFIGTNVGAFGADYIGRTAVFKGMRHAMVAGQAARHVNVGGNYKDTEYAFTMRQRAAQEMGSSLLNARQYLGQEGNLYHT